MLRRGLRLGRETRKGTRLEKGGSLGTVGWYNSQVLVDSQLICQLTVHPYWVNSRSIVGWQLDSNLVTTSWQSECWLTIHLVTYWDISTNYWPRLSQLSTDYWLTRHQPIYQRIYQQKHLQWTWSKKARAE